MTSTVQCKDKYPSIGSISAETGLRLASAGDPVDIGSGPLDSTICYWKQVVGLFTSRLWPFGRPEALVCN
jgi:hypothetical protein